MQEGNLGMEKSRQAILTLIKLQQIICYIKTFWFYQVNSKNLHNFQTQSQLKESHDQNSNTMRVQLISSCYKVVNGRMFLQEHLGRSRAQETIRLKNVNSFLEAIDLSLNEVMEGLQTIAQTLSQYQNIEVIHKNENERMNQQMNCSDSTNSLECLDAEVFNNTFRYINKNLFGVSFRQMLQKSPKQMAIWLLAIQTKLSVLPQLIDSASKFATDITTCEPTVERYSYAWKNIQVIEMDNHCRQRVEDQINQLRKMMKITTSAVVAEHSSIKVDFIQKIVFGLSFPYYWLADEESELHCYKIWRNPKVEALNNVWNLPENGAIRQCKKIIFTSIKTNLFIYVPAQKPLYETSVNRKPNIFLQPRDPSIRVLMLYYGRLNYVQDCKKYDSSSLFSCMDVAQENDLDTILIHLHGGGFVALSSQTTQSYTRRWANQLKIPVFSVDYRKPPTYRFPVPLEDCLTAYKFIIENIHKYFKIKPTRVILAGDSAGGNLAVALYALLLQSKYQVLPIGMLLAYPAVDLRMRFSPSRMNSFDDPILLPPLLLLCLKEYLGQNKENQWHPLASPVLLNEQFIKTGQSKADSQQMRKWPRNWPRTSIMVGKKDPLYDDSLRLLQRMTEAGVDAKLIVYSQFSHAFLSLDNMMPSCDRTIRDSILQIEKLLKA